jgi:hypothetical protein
MVIFSGGPAVFSAFLQDERHNSNPEIKSIAKKLLKEKDSFLLPACNMMSSWNVHALNWYL